ncbi:MAG: gephyrin-like molybdotransferase Glp [Cyanobacteria bacterium P01_D01_bin.105]
MFTAAEAERLIFTLVTSVQETEMLELMGAKHDLMARVLAAPVRSKLDFPHWDNSAMDGYAVRAADMKQLPVTLEIIEEIPAGKRPQKTVNSGQAARIFTGAMMPEGADTVVMQEETTCDGNEVKLLNRTEKRVEQKIEPGTFVRKRGSFSKVGDILLPAGRSLTPAEIALIAAAQQTQVRVYRRPKVAILSTGNELAQANEPLNPGQIVDSNQYALSALVAQTGAIPIPLGIVKDDREAVKAAIASALSQADMVISTGGVSVGDYDYVDDILAELGATLHIRSVAVKPGKPLTVATIDSANADSANADSAKDSANGSANGSVQSRQVYFGLPGNPASAMVGFWRFVAPAIAKLSGRLESDWGPTLVWAEATSELNAGGRRETYLWGQLQAGKDGYQFGRAAGSHSSGNLVNLANTSGLGIVPQGETSIAIGQRVRVLAIR